MKDLIFDLHNCNCSYNNSSLVLQVEGLEIPRGKFIVILGPSGAGKSTLLETIGLMNNTLMENSELHFFPLSENKINFSFTEVWKSGREKILSDIRNKYFSFIFQETNLMQNFTVFENIVITQLIQGKSIRESKDKVREMMKLMGLEEIDDNKKVYELSGGQKQRVAFVRAVLPDYEVIFGDEPTGNLDDKNASELMTVLKETAIRNNKTAIIVSHNIDLAMNFADMLILLTQKNNVGQIEKDNIYLKKESGQWKNFSQDNIADLQKRVQHVLKQ